MSTTDSSSISVTPRYPLELHYIKSLFLHERYRQCIQACRGVLKTGGNTALQQPLQQTFISFYLGLSHEELARSMHHSSQAKLPAFVQAETCYRDALQSLPTRAETLSEHELVAQSPPRTPPMPQSVDDRSGTDSYSSPSFAQLSPPSLSISPPNFSRIRSPTTRSVQNASRESTSSDLNSDTSFDQIMTPNKVLQREISHMSLLDSALQQPILERDMSRMSLLEHPSNRPPLPTTMSEGLMRPIRPGEPPRAFHVLPRLPYVGSAASTSRLPKLMTYNTWTSPIRHVPKTVREERYSPQLVSPVSSIHWDEVNSTVSAVSPVSPQTPAHYLDSPPSKPVEDTPERSQLSDESPDPYHGMRIQLKTHLRLLDRARTHAIETQATRRALSTNAAPITNPPFQPSRSSLESGFQHSRPESVSSKHDSVVSEPKRPSELERSSQLQRKNFYYAFTPQNVEVGQSTFGFQKRIELGRERGWVRSRFDGRGYAVLAEMAVAEL
ncbi:hypothetical protein LTR62_001034 [Meristemomyces frigidus]|uniref:Uncharacterized protein n=1 Tax=Meristemomyces frigidus TaxID=1508187 RepID=A0AAN7TGS4_9PEZI|nr:hypothetical protein LTR62_001034 [Meristemomyces frigidus]